MYLYSILNAFRRGRWAERRFCLVLTETVQFDFCKSVNVIFGRSRRKVVPVHVHHTCTWFFSHLCSSISYTGTSRFQIFSYWKKSSCTIIIVQWFFLIKRKIKKNRMLLISLIWWTEIFAAGVFSLSKSD